MARLVALDTETTGLDPTVEDVFEIAAVDLDTGWERVWHIEPRPAVVAAMHPRAVEVNRYHERITAPGWVWDHPATALGELYRWLDGSHIVGAVPDFDTRHLTALYRRFLLVPPRWHYHLIDIEAMAVGWLHAQYPDRDGKSPDLTLPWYSDVLSLACGVDPPSSAERHTALGDARWVADWYRKLTG